MSFTFMGRIAGIAALTVGLAGCMDVTTEIDILSETNGRVTTTSTVGADFYPMIKSGMAAAEAEDGAESDGFCEEAGATLTENADGSATCVAVVEGAFAELGEGDGGAKFEVVSPGVVKVSFTTTDMKGEIGADETLDAETKAMMQTFFEGHSITIRVKGRDVIDTNLTKAADGKSAEVAIPFLDLINGTTDLPDELYATVRTN